MKTITKLCALAAVTSMVAATNAFAVVAIGDTGTIQLVSPTLGGNDGGGAFTAATTPTIGQNLGTFSTFCIEYNEHINYNTPYTYVVNDKAVKGGYSVLPDGTAGASDPLSSGTAWLFSQWQGYLIAHTADNANKLQEAIWYLEGETSETLVTVAGVKQAHVYTYAPGNNTYIDLAVSQFNDLATAKAAAASGAYGTYVLNVYSGSAIEQDQLYSSVPETSTIMAGALLLLPFGASTIRILRKNRAA